MNPSTATRPHFDEIKAQADVTKGVESYGLTLQKAGADFVGLCPFDGDSKLSVQVMPTKQLWNCRASQRTMASPTWRNTLSTSISSAATVGRSRQAQARQAYP